MKTGLVLEGGGMRGMYTAGVLDVMMENGITVDGAVGVSAGAVFGCNFKSKQIGRVIRYNTKYCRDSRYLSYWGLLKTGDLYGPDFCYRELPDVLDPFDKKTYEENPMEFYVTCTDVKTGKPVYHLCKTGDGEDVRWMQASASMPLVANSVSVGGYELLDGGISDSIPITWFRSIGYERNIIVLTQPKEYRKKKSAGLSLLKRVLSKYPAVVSAMETRHENYNESLDKIKELLLDGDTLVIQPSERIKIKRTERNPGNLRKLYELGRKDAEAQLEEVKRFLEKSFSANGQKEMDV